MNIVVKQGSNEHRIEGVSTWWYEGIDLRVRYPDDEIETFPGGDVMEMF